MPETTSRSGAQFLLTAAAAVVVFAGIKAAASIVIPVLLAAFVAIIISPAYLWLIKRHVPAIVAVLLMVTLLLGATAGTMTIVGTSIDQFTTDLPTYEAGAKRKWHAVQDWVKDLLPAHLEEEPQTGTAPGASEVAGTIGGGDPEAAPAEPTPPKAESSSSLEQVLNVKTFMSFIATMLSSLRYTLTNAFIILLIMVFALLEATSFPNKLQAIMTDRDDYRRVLLVVSNVRRYMALKTLVSLATGSLALALVASLHIDFAVMWGLLAFLLNFIPNIGSLIAALPPILLAIVDEKLGLGTAMWVAVGYFAINTIIGSIIEPRIMGRGVGLSALVVFVSLIFWGWILGPVGMILSVPLTMTAKIALEAADDTRWVAVLLGGSVPDQET